MRRAITRGIQLSNHPHIIPRAMAVLIVAYRSADELEKCILSVERNLPGHDVHVWDNSGPTHSDVRRLADRMQHVHWHVGTENIGFGAAVNRLVAKVPDRDLLLVNPDAELIGPLTLTRAAIREPRTAAAAPMIWESGVEDRSASLLSRTRLPWDVAHRKLTFLNALGGTAGVAERLRGTCAVQSLSVTAGGRRWLSDRRMSSDPPRGVGLGGTLR